MPEVIYPELSYRIMEAVFSVHKELGPGFVESVYENAPMEEFRSKGLKFENQKNVPVEYKGRKIGRHKLDLLVEDKIVLELKIVEILCAQHKAQLLSYLKATGYKLGILINFSKSRVEYKRIINLS